jgi:hypothetical protein
MSKHPQWPAEVPVLTAKDIHRGDLDGPRGTHCLLGWGLETFHDESARHEARRAMKQHIETVYSSVGVFNDDADNPKTEIARVWNRAMADLGYTEGNPEAPKAKVDK